MLTMQSPIATPQRDRTVHRNSLVYEPQSNGGAEKAVQDFTDMARRLLIGFESRLKSKVALLSPRMPWTIRHAGFIFTKYRMGQDGPPTRASCAGTGTAQWARSANR